MKTFSMKILLSMLSLLLLGTAMPISAQTQPNITPVFFTGVVGGDEIFGRRILLRWDTLDGFVELENAVIYRTDGQNMREKIAVVQRTRSPKLIESIFYREGEDRILEDAKMMMERIVGSEPVTPQEFSQMAIAILDGKDNTDHGVARRNYMVQTNYGFALVEGLGYLDYVDPNNGPFTYELWQGDANGNAVDALGEIQVDAMNPIILPPPTNLVEVFLRGRDGVTPARGNHRRIYLNFDMPTDYNDFATTAFGFNIYKLPRALEAGEDYESVKDEVVRLNKTPILEPSPIVGEDPDQTYIFADSGEWLETLNEDDLLTVGDTCTYWAVARDLLGNEGLPSDPLEATVRDTFEPNPPRGVFVQAVKNDDLSAFLKVLWNEMDPDVVAYRIYRYQDYTNNQKKGPFPPMNGLTEGFIAEIPAPAQPVNGKVIYDDDEAGEAPRGTAFWYSISALDEHGNESALSPGAYGVIDDVVGPAPGRIQEYCVSRPSIFVSGNLSSQAGTRETEWRPIFTIRRTHPAIERVSISQKIGDGQVVLLVPIVELDFFANDELLYELPAIQVADQDDINIYRFTVTALDGTTQSIELGPPVTWEPGNERQIYRVEASIRGFEEICDPLGPSDIDVGLVPVIPGGDQPPFKISMDCSGDAVAYRLYRSVNGCKDYELVEEVPCENLSSIMEDNFHPETIAEVCYSIVPVDKHGNLGLPQYFDPIIVYLGNFPNPTMVSVQATGLPANPDISLSWIGPFSGAQFYRIHFVENGNKQTRPLEVPINDLTYDPSQNEFTYVTSVINRDGGTLAGNANYEVFVEAVAITGAAKESDRLPFTWASKAFNDQQNGDFRWNARPLPPVLDWTPERATFTIQNGINGVVIRVLEVGGGEAGIDSFTVPSLPFLVWRQRQGKGDQPWVLVSPLIESINKPGGALDDGFFVYLPDFVTQQDELYFVDDSGHVGNTSYRYLFMELEPDTYEIKQLRGPFTVGTTIPGR